jgi:hypothetical protein
MKMPLEVPKRHVGKRRPFLKKKKKKRKEKQKGMGDLMQT